MFDFTKEACDVHQAWVESEAHERYESAYDALVPDQGECDSFHGEALRLSSRLVYDIFNNGLCNDKRPELNGLLKAVKDCDRLFQIVEQKTDTLALEKLLCDLLTYVEIGFCCDLDDEEGEWEPDYELNASDTKSLLSLVDGIVDYCYETIY